MTASAHFVPDCRACPRLAAHLDAVREKHAGRAYHCRPVPSFGGLDARLLIVGLAPGEHGANRTGRPFTGDEAGFLLYPTLHKFGWATSPDPLAADGEANPVLALRDCRITNAVRCLPPQNKVVGAEVSRCNDYLRAEIVVMPNLAAIVALGTVAHGAVLRAHGLKLNSLRFGHGAAFDLPGGVRLFDSFHCSGYNTKTRRLTPEMFESVFAAARDHLAGRG